MQWCGSNRSHLLGKLYRPFACYGWWAKFNCICYYGSFLWFVKKKILSCRLRSTRVIDLWLYLINDASRSFSPLHFSSSHLCNVLHRFARAEHEAVNKLIFSSDSFIVHFLLRSLIANDFLVVHKCFRCSCLTLSLSASKDQLHSDAVHVNTIDGKFKMRNENRLLKFKWPVRFGSHKSLRAFATAKVFNKLSTSCNNCICICVQQCCSAIQSNSNFLASDFQPRYSIYIEQEQAIARVAFVTFLQLTYTSIGQYKLFSGLTTILLCIDWIYSTYFGRYIPIAHSGTKSIWGHLQ